MRWEDFDMRLIHNSRDAAYRLPLGVAAGGLPSNSKCASRTSIRNQVDMTLRTWMDRLGQSLIPMTHEGDGVLSPRPSPVQADARVVQLPR